MLCVVRNTCTCIFLLMYPYLFIKYVHVVGSEKPQYLVPDFSFALSQTFPGWPGNNVHAEQETNRAKAILHGDDSVSLSGSGAKGEYGTMSMSGRVGRYVLDLCGLNWPTSVCSRQSNSEWVFTEWSSLWESMKENRPVGLCPFVNAVCRRGLLTCTYSCVCKLRGK